LFKDKFDFEFHLSSILELFRISLREIRTYPIQVQGSLEPHYFINELLSELNAHGIEYEILSSI